MTEMFTSITSAVYYGLTCVSTLCGLSFSSHNNVLHHESVSKTLALSCFLIVMVDLTWFVFILKVYFPWQLLQKACMWTRVTKERQWFILHFPPKSPIIYCQNELSDICIYILYVYFKVTLWTKLLGEEDKEISSIKQCLPLIFLSCLRLSLPQFRTAF